MTLYVTDGVPLDEAAQLTLIAENALIESVGVPGVDGKVGGTAVPVMPRVALWVDAPLL